MAGEGARVLVRFLALRGHGGGGELDGLTNAHVAGLTTVDDISAVFPHKIGGVFVDINLADFRSPGFHAVLQIRELRGRKVHHVIGEVGIHQLSFFVDGLDEFAELGAQLGTLVFQIVVGFFQMVEVKYLLFAIGHLYAGFLLFVSGEIF